MKKKVEDLKDEIYKTPEINLTIPKLDKETEVLKSEFDFTSIKGVGKATQEEITKKLEKIGIDTKPKIKGKPVTIPSKELFRLVFNDLLAKKHKRKKLTMDLDEQELKACGTATDLMLAKYPDANLLARFVEINFAVTLGGIIVPRIILLVKQLIEQRRQVPEQIPEELPDLHKQKKTKKNE